MINFSSFFNIDWISVIYVINIILTFAIIFLERKNPAATLAWILVLFVLPGAGIILYALFSQNIARKQIYKVTEGEKRIITEELQKQSREMEEDSFQYTTDVAEKWKNLIRLNQVYGNAYLTQNNDIEIFTDGKDMFRSLVKDIQHANKSVNVMTYILKDDKVGSALIDILTDKAREGVEVRLMMDALGSRMISDRKLKAFILAGGKVAYFFKPKLKLINLKLNYRNHRKIAVIDGKKGYIGGFNVAKEYLGLKRKFGYWRDTHIKIKGGAVQDLYARFLMDWRYASKEDTELSQAYFGAPAEAGNTPVQILSCGPNSPREEIKRSMMRMITFAEKSIYLQTPYFIPDPSMIESLKMASQSGVDVNIMIPCMPDHIFVYWATYSYVGELLRAGARVFIYDGGFLHAKTLTVDGEVTTIGSANFDQRSFRLNFESNAIIYDRRVAGEMEKTFMDDVKRGHELTLQGYNERSIIIRFKEAVSRLLSDIL